MSVAEAAHRPANTGRAVKLWLGFLVIIAAGVGLAWVGAGSLRPQISETGLEFALTFHADAEEETLEEHEAAENDVPKDDGGEDGSNVVSVDFTRKK